MNKQPLFILVLCFILGIFFQDRFLLNEHIVYFIIAACSLILTSLFFHSYLLFKVKPFLVGLLFFGIGIIIHYFNTFSSKETVVAKNDTIVFKISKKLNSTQKNKKYEIFVQAGKEVFNAILYTPGNSQELDFNHYYKSQAYITEPKSPQQDFQFDYARYLKRKDIKYQCYLTGKISSVIRNDLNIDEKILQRRLDVLQNINNADMSPKSREFLKGIILADRTEIDAETVQDFNRSGLVHFLAISGTHIVVIFGLFYFLFTRFLPLQFRKYAVISSLIFIWMFAGFIGFGNSVLRSCIMLSTYFIYVLLQRKPDLLHSLALSAFVILILDTQQIFDVGFQLSFVAVLGIFWLNQPLLKYLPRQDNYLKKVFYNTVSISVAAQLATLPLVLYYFHQFSFMSIIANFAIVPFSEIIIVFSFIITALIAFNIEFDFINNIYDFVIQILLKSIHWFADFNDLFFENIPMNLVEIIFLFVIMYLLRFTILRFNLKNSARLVMAVLMFFIVRTSFNIIEAQKEEVLVYDFYKNRLFSIKKGGNACFWIGNNSDKEKIIKYIVNPYVSSRRLNHVQIKTFPAATQKAVYHGRVYNIN